MKKMEKNPRAFVTILKDLFGAITMVSNKTNGIPTKIMVCITNIIMSYKLNGSSGAYIANNKNRITNAIIFKNI